MIMVMGGEHTSKQRLSQRETFKKNTQQKGTGKKKGIPKVR